MKQPLFSVLIANYNNGKYIADCLDSIMKQSYQNFEIVIVDDASPDNSAERIDAYIHRDSRISVYHNEVNRGTGYTKKRCIDLSRGEICGFVDPDDILHPDALQVMVESHQKNQTHAGIYCTHYVCDEHLNILDIGSAIYQQPEGVPVYKDPHVSQFFTFKKRLYDKTIGLNPSYKRAVDRDLYTLMDEVGPLLFIDPVLYYYRHNPNSISLNANKFKAQYWDLIVRHNAAMRRGESLEDHYAKSIDLYDTVLQRMTLKETIYLLLQKLKLVR